MTLDGTLLKYSLTTLLFGGIAALVVAALIWLVFSELTSPLRSYPGPFLARWTNLWRLYQVQTQRYQWTIKDLHNKYGPVVRIGPNLLDLDYPELIKTIYSTDGKWCKTEFYHNSSAVINGKITYHLFSTTDQAAHARLKRPIVKYYSMSNILNLESHVDTVISDFCDHLETRFMDKQSQEKQFDFGQWIAFYTWDMISSATFSQRFGYMEKAYDFDGTIHTADQVTDYFAMVGQMPFLDYLLDKNPIKRIGPPNLGNVTRISVEKMMSRVDKLDEIDRKPAEELDFLDHFLNAMKKSPDLVDTSVITGYLQVNMLAGADTTAITLRAIFNFLLENPLTMIRLKKELLSLDYDGIKEKVVSYKSARAVPYLDAVIRESMRMHPGVGMLLERYVPDTGLQLPDGSFVPGGTAVGLNPYIIGRNKGIWGDDADEFRPERWLQKSGEDDEAFQQRLRQMNGADLTFGGGSRICIGRNLALLEIYKVVATLVSRYEILSVPGQKMKIISTWFPRQSGLICQLPFEKVIVSGCLFHNRVDHYVEGTLWSRIGNFQGRKSERIHEAHAMYGSVVRVGPNELSFSTPAAVQAIYTSNNFTKEETFYNHLFSFRDAEAHKIRRKNFSRGFSQSSMLDFEPHVSSKIKALLNQWAARANSGPIDVYPWCHWLGFDVIYHLMFDEDPGSVQRGQPHQVMRYIKAWKPTFIYKEFLPQMEQYGVYVSGPVGGYFRDVRTWKEYALTLIEEVRQKDSHTPFLRNVLSADKDEDTTQHLTNSELAEECMGGMFGGSGTTANTFIYTLWACLRQPKVVTKLRSELLQAFQDTTSVPDYQTCSKLPYLQAVINETLRRYPTIVATLPRTTNNDTIIDGIPVPKGTIVGTQNFTMHRNEDAFPSPEEFIPERWLTTDGNDTRKASWTPFSVGSRRCIGINLAQMELSKLTAAFFLRFDGKVDESMTEEDMRIYISDLEARVQEYERQSQATVSLSSVIYGTNAYPDLSPTQDSVLGRGKDKWHHQIRQQPDMEMIYDPPSTSHAHYEGVPSDDRFPTPPRTDSVNSDAMVVVPSPECGDSKDLGQSSSISFIQSMLRTVNRDDSVFRVSHHPANNQYPFLQAIDEEALFLPPRKVADGFVQAYWKFLHPILPILHRPTLMRLYDKLWMVDDTRGSSKICNVDDAVFFSTLNIVLAIGCQFSEQMEPTRKLTMASKFYQRSKALLTDELLDYPSLALVQLLLLTGVYLQSTEHANRCWNIVGSAIRSAQSMSLHLDRKRNSINQVEREMERRVWHACVFLDRQLACTFGRPPMVLDSSSVPKPEMINDEYLSETGQGFQPLDAYPQMGCFIYSCNLFDILHQVLVEFYVNKKPNPHSNNKDSLLGEEIQVIMGYHRELNKFQETLPPFLVTSGRYMDSPFTDESGTALGSRILHSRPIVLLVAQVSNEAKARNMLSSQDSLDRHLALKACTFCISTTQELVAHMYENMGTSYWTSISHKIHYAFACVVVLAAARLYPMLSADVDKESIQASWSQCMRVFDRYKLQSPAASHVMRILAVLESRLPGFEPGINGRQFGTHILTGERDALEEQVCKSLDDNERILGSGMSLDSLQELDFDSTWAILDELLQCESSSYNMTSGTGQGGLNSGIWGELL
ncbi:cytochrome P450 monooxygenase [Fusarium circinatum]|uniref:Cytochrome P450 monooxygenase n=1 Tax=Fusarium circinatum TaxID=48490 RepID=A0A8H5TI20_FUSCI|nr:cytochrome P450 monooxygenase [Fusarium circinatum]